MSNKHDYMLPAYVGFLHWAFGSTDILLHYTSVTRKQVVYTKNPITNSDSLAVLDDVAVDYVLWVTKEYWGSDAAPSIYYEILKKANARHDHPKTKI